MKIEEVIQPRDAGALKRAITANPKGALAARRVGKAAGLAWQRGLELPHALIQEKAIRVAGGNTGAQRVSRLAARSHRRS